MANEKNETATDPSEVIKKIEADLASRDQRIKELERDLKRFSKGPVKAQPEGDCVYLAGVRYDIIGDFRADNTFAEVKKGHCPEGVTLLAINKPH